MGNFVGLSVEKMESELQFSIFFCGCKQSKSVHILLCRKINTFSSDNKISHVKCHKKAYASLPTTTRPRSSREYITKTALLLFT